MHPNAQLVRHSIVLTLGRNPSIRRELNAFEDIVKGYSDGGYSQPQVVPVPDELDAEIPRVIFSSKGGHTQLLVSQVGVLINIEYSPDWAVDFQKCLAHAQGKVELLFELAAAGWKRSPPLFAGVTTQSRFVTGSQSEAVAFVAPSFVECERLTKTANELSYRWSLDVDGRFYNNISVGSVQKVSDLASAASGNIPRFNPATIEHYAVDVSNDYNDRLAYNTSEQYTTDAGTVREMILAGWTELTEALKAISERSTSC